MSPKMYGLVWTAVAVVFGILWLGGVFSMLVGVVFGFVAFGLVFMGMMCVLPAAVSHPVQAPKPVKAAERSKQSAAVVPTYRSA